MKYTFFLSGSDSPHYMKCWVIQKRFLWLFWRNYKKMKYRILSDGTPNFNEVMDYVEQLNKNKDE